MKIPAICLFLVMSSFGVQAKQAEHVNVIMPNSSIVRKSDVGIRAHTNTHRAFPIPPAYQPEPPPASFHKGQ